MHGWLRDKWPAIIALAAAALMAVSVGYLLGKGAVRADEIAEVEQVRLIVQDYEQQHGKGTAVDGLREQNPDAAAWIGFGDEGFPVMWTPDDPEKYISLSFAGTPSSLGTPFLGEGCDPVGGNSRIVYGHHMRDGSMFAFLEDYMDRDYAVANPITYENERGTGTYVPVAAMKVDVTGSHYPFQKKVGELSSEEMEEFADAVSGLASWCDGWSANDDVLMVATCSYGTANERLVIVARRV